MKPNKYSTFSIRIFGNTFKKHMKDQLEAKNKELGPTAMKGEAEQQRNRVTRIGGGISVFPPSGRTCTSDK